MSATIKILDRLVSVTERMAVAELKLKAADQREAAAIERTRTINDSNNRLTMVNADLLAKLQEQTAKARDGESRFMELRQAAAAMLNASYAIVEQNGIARSKPKLDARVQFISARGGLMKMMGL